MFWQASGLRMREPILGYEAGHSAVTKDRQRQCSLFSRSGIANEESEFNFKLYQYPKPLILDSFPSLRRIRKASSPRWGVRREVRHVAGWVGETGRIRGFNQLGPWETNTKLRERLLSLPRPATLNVRRRAVIAIRFTR